MWHNLLHTIYSLESQIEKHPEKSVMIAFNTYGRKSVQQTMFPISSQQNLKDTTVSVKSHNTSTKLGNKRGWTIKFTNLPPCARRGSIEKKPWYGLMTLTYQRFTAVLLLIYGSLFVSGIYYCLRVFRCAIARVSELELEQRMNIKWDSNQF
jgi:hypothetical protein